MSQLDLGMSPFQEASATDVPADAASNAWSKIESALDRASEWLNPILVKEARQALKSRQFIVTFTLLLVFGWSWSVAGVAMMSQAAYYAPGGRFMLTGYFLILAVPLFVIVPFSAFRSLAAEREDGTFELLSITSLEARQIIAGKLGSAILQMAVYYSALAPCIAFTYLLRGIDVLTIGLMLFYTFLLSVLLSQFGLIIATVTRSAQWQVLLSVLLILFLAWCDFIASYALIALIHMPGSLQFDSIYFWVSQVAILTFYASFFALFLFAAAAQISFPSDNRSTKLRIVMLVQQVLWLGWMTYVMVEIEEADVLYAVAPFAAGYWFVAGCLLCGESPQLSPRVRRSLPQSFLGRSLFTWFNPGSGTGYTFAVLNIWSVVAFVAIGALTAELFGSFGSTDALRVITGSSLCAAYATAFVGCARLITIALRTRLQIGLILPLLMGVVFGLLGVFIPLVLNGWLSGFSKIEYTEMQATNWAWTIEQAYYETLWNFPLVPIGVHAFALLIFTLNLFLAMREVEHVRLATPQRVLEDEWQLHPEKAPVVHRPRSPWDE